MLRNTAIGLFAFVLAASGAQICDLNFKVCPGSYNGKTITVPMDVISLDPKFALCPEQVQVAGGSVNPPSIVFIIDNSGSMENSRSNPGSDPAHARFTKVSSLLDSILKIAPSAEVGVVIFATRLSYDYNKNGYLKRAYPADNSLLDAYVPLTQLNQKFANGRSGIDTLKYFLNATCTNGGCTVPAFSSQADANTDITLGFEAAKMAIAPAKAAKDNQYFIFLSDGLPNVLPSSDRYAMRNDFIKGVNDPTTFSIFFDPRGDAAPDTIVMMTDSIRVNGYSATNPKSNYWASSLPGTQLQGILQDQVLNQILSNVNATPATATLTVGGQTYNNVSVDAKEFIFPKRIPLSATETTLQFIYSYTYIDNTGGVSTKKQKSVPYTVTISRSSTATIPDSLAKTCRDPASLTLVAGGKTVTQVTDDKTNLEIRLKPSTGDVCTNCTVTVKPSVTNDKETVTLSTASGYYTGSFTRALTTPATPENGKLEHAVTDSIILVYVNPENPLETVRTSYPFIPSLPPSTVDWSLHNSFAQNDDVTIDTEVKDWVLVAPANLSVKADDGSANRFTTLSGNFSSEDSLRYVGFRVEASGPFKVQVYIYSNLGVLVNKLTFAVPASEYAKLEKGSKPDTRIMRVLWNNRTMDGGLVGTGAYIFRSQVTLDPESGKAPSAPLTNTRIVGVLRTR